MNAFKKLRILFFFLFPFALLLLLEITLRIFNAGIPSAPFQKYQANAATENPDYYRLFHPRPGSRQDQPGVVNFFPFEKPKSKLRGLVVGESTAQGFPFFANQSFGKIAEQILKSQGIDVEILNFGRAAMTSYYLRDILPELLNLKPDFLVIYAGHNEFYGTPSLSTNPSHWANLLNLTLKKTYVFQNFFNLITPVPGNKTTMMQERFEALPKDQRRLKDEAVYDVFYDNLKAGLAGYFAQKIPVILMDPVSNISDMPPFRAVGMEEKDLWSQGLKALNDPDPGVWAAYVKKIEEKNLTNSALHLFLQGKRLEIQGKTDLALYLKAKEADLVPFRSTEYLRNQLKLQAETWGKESPVYWFSTYEGLKNGGISNPYGNAGFIDHLHFNWNGQKAVGLSLAEVILKSILKKSIKEESWAAGAKSLEDKTFFTPFFEWYTLNQVTDLIKDEPYKGMPLRTDFGLGPQMARLEAQIGPEIITRIKSSSSIEWVKTALELLEKEKRFQEAKDLVSGFVWVSPGSWNANVVRGLSGLNQGENLSTVYDYLQRGLLLSRGLPLVKNMIKESLVQKGLDKDAEVLLSKF